MIPRLLWRCPICKQNDALVEKKQFFKPLRVICTHCSTAWTVRRQVGVDYWLAVASSPKFPEQVGKDQPLNDWYDQMKATVTLTPIFEKALPLGEGEELLLASKKVTLTVASDDRVFFPDPAPDAVETVIGVKIGFGRIFLTNQRVIWKGADGRLESFSLAALTSAYAKRKTDFVLFHQMHLYELRFHEESMLKWVNYFALVSQAVHASTGHLISTSTY